MTITLSPKFQIVIPKKVREQLKLRAGLKFEVFAHQGRIELVQEQPISSLRGAYPKLTQIVREPDRDL